ncbi:MAG: tetratricopeptide repeat protein [Dehalococcoidia bacterium]|nr:tetratricopeptide repeat protein [Dehalococcoidia bacterium]
MSHSRTFADLLTEYMARTGIGDAELARRINVNRLTLIRWREGVTERPRHRDDVARCADVLRLTPEERDEFLLAAGFEPDSPVAASPTGDDSDGDAVEKETGADRAIQPSTAQFPLNQKWTLAVAAVAVVVLLGAGLALVTDNLNLIDPDPTPIPASPTAIATYTPAATPTATATVPTATPLPATVARDGESLILLAPFANYTAGAQGYNVSGRLQERIDAELHLSGLANARTFLWPDTIRTEGEARSVTERSGALLTIWGEYDSGRVLARFTTAQSPSGAVGQPVVNIASSPSELPTTINVNLTGAVRYVALMTSGRVYLDQGEYDRAKAVLRRATIPPPEDPAALADVRYLLGIAYLNGQRFDYDESIAWFTLVLEVEPLSVDALNGRAVAYMRRDRAGDVQLARTDLFRAESIEPDHAETHSNRGRAHMLHAGSDDLNRAIASFSQAIELVPDNGIAYIDRAGAYVARGQASDLTLARTDLDHALELEPSLAEVFVTTGLLFVARGGRAEVLRSIAEYTQAIELAPESPDAWFHRGLANSELGFLTESAADLEKAAEFAPHSLRYQDSTCRALVVAGDAGSGLRYCDLAVQVGYSQALYSRALAKAMLGLADDAESDLADYMTWAESLSPGSCRTALLDAAVLLEAPIATARGGAEMWDLLEFRPRPVIPGRPAC